MSTAREIHVGSPPNDFFDGESVTIHFHSFTTLPSKRGQYVESPTFHCAGYPWRLRLYPNGAPSSRHGMTSVFLHTESSSAVEARYDVTLRKGGGGGYKTTTGGGVQRRFDPGTARNKWGRPNFVRRKEILFSKKILNDGALTFIVRIKPSEECCRGPLQQSDNSSIGDNIFNRLFNDKDSADVAFDVAGVLFYAHKPILKAQAPELHEFAMPFNTEMNMPIDDVQPTVFEIMLKYVYGKSVLDREWREHSKAILDASGKYGLSALETEAAAWRETNLDTSDDDDSASSDDSSSEDGASEASASAWFPSNDPPGEHSDEMQSDEVPSEDELPLEDELPSDGELSNELPSDRLNPDEELPDTNHVAYC